MQINKAEFLMSNTRFEFLPNDNIPEYAFIGRSNVGKSSLINMLVQRKGLAKTSSVPGKTVAINHFIVNDAWYLVDLPGYGYAKVAKTEKQRWAGLIEGYLNADRNIELVFLLIDMRHAPTADDLHMINFLIDNELPFVIILTKADKLNKTERAKAMKVFSETIPCYEDIHIIPFSSQTFEGVEEVRKIIEETAEDARVYSETEEIPE